MAERILVPVDGSMTMERTVRLACGLAKELGGSITLMHVVALPFPTEESIPFDYTPLERYGKDILESAQRLAKEYGCNADTLLEVDYGNAGHAIARIGRERGITLIVIHARGHSKLDTLLLGSVCHAVAHRASCPVLIVRP